VICVNTIYRMQGMEWGGVRIHLAGEISSRLSFAADRRGRFHSHLIYSSGPRFTSFPSMTEVYTVTQRRLRPRTCLPSLRQRTPKPYLQRNTPIVRRPGIGETRISAVPAARAKANIQASDRIAYPYHSYYSIFLLPPRQSHQSSAPPVLTSTP
jgi:hypothetical protein